LKKFDDKEEWEGYNQHIEEKNMEYYGYPRPSKLKVPGRGRGRPRSKKYYCLNGHKLTKPYKPINNLGYVNGLFKCDICSEFGQFKNGVYRCAKCYYDAHIKCIEDKYKEKVHQEEEKEEEKEEVDALGDGGVDMFKGDPSSNDDDGTNVMKIIIKCRNSK